MVSTKARAVIWARAAGRCSFPGCNELLIGDYIAGNEDANFGFVAHIVAETPGGPRGDPVRSPALEDAPSNLMLMCSRHHKLIDVDEKENYPEQRLLDIKAAHEDRIRTVTGIAADRASHVLRYGAKIGEYDSAISFQRVRVAMLPDRYPAEGRSIGIEIRGNAASDGEEAFWNIEPANLQRQFDTLVRPRIAEGEIRHVSVFALGPIPLLVLLGRLLGDITPGDVFQLHREPAGWNWANDREHLQFYVTRPNQRVVRRETTIVVLVVRVEVLGLKSIQVAPMSPQFRDDLLGGNRVAGVEVENMSVTVGHSGASMQPVSSRFAASDTNSSRRSSRLGT
jgi:hypothetical protein